MTGTTLRHLTEADLLQHLEALCRLLIDTVADGAAISFLHPVSTEQARAFWQNEVRPSVAAQERALFAAFQDAHLIGSVQIVTALPTNQPHRAEIAKMMVHPAARRRGVGRQLLLAALEHAKAAGKTLVTLDTRTGDVSQGLYASAGFEEAGIIPDFALDPDGENLHPTTYMFKRL